MPRPLRLSLDVLPAPGSRRGRAVIVFALAAAVYGNSLWGDLIFDDQVAVANNADVTSANATDWAGIFAHDFWGGELRDAASHKSYRPLTVLSFRANYLLHGLEVEGYHLVNIFLHGLASVLVLLLSSTLGFSEDEAFAAALLFSVHPVHTEAVSSVVGRAELLGAVFFLGALLLYCAAALQPWRGSLYSVFTVAAAMACVSVGFLCKETVITALGVCGVIEVAYVWAASRAAVRTRCRLLCVSVCRIAVLAATGIGLVAARFMLTAEDAAPDGASGFVVRGFRRADNPIPFIEDATSRWLTTVYTWVVYARLLVFPTSLCADYSYDAIPALEGWTDLRVVGVCALAIGLLCASVVAFRSLFRGQLVAAGALVLLPMLPASNLFFHPGTMIAERLLYVPSLGSTLLCVAALRAAVAPRAKVQVVSSPTAGGQGVTKLSAGSRRRTKIAGMLLHVVLALCAGRTWTRNWEWASSEALFTSALSVSPGSAKVQLNCGVAAWDAGRPADAKAFLLRAEAIDDQGCQPQYWLGRVALDAKDYAEAARRFQKALDCRELDHDVFAREALEAMYREAIRVRPNQPDGYANLANILLLMKSFDEAGEHFRKALELKPDDPTYLANYGYLAIAQGDAVQAVRLLRKALAARPDFTIAQQHLSQALAMLSEEQRAAFNEVRSGSDGSVSDDASTATQEDGSTSTGAKTTTKEQKTKKKTTKKKKKQKKKKKKRGGVEEDSGGGEASASASQQTRTLPSAASSAAAAPASSIEDAQRPTTKDAAGATQAQPELPQKQNEAQVKPATEDATGTAQRSTSNKQKAESTEKVKQPKKAKNDRKEKKNKKAKKVKTDKKKTKKKKRKKTTTK